MLYVQQVSYVPKYGRQTERRDAAKRVILDATVALIAKHGPAGFSISQIISLAKVSRGLPAHYFGSKEGLLAAAAGWLLRPSDAPDPTDLRSLRETLLALAERKSGAERIEADAVLALIAGPLPEAMQTLVNRYRQRNVARIANGVRAAQAAGELRSGFDAEAVAAVLFASAVDQRRMQRANPTPEGSEAFSSLLGSLLAEPAATTLKQDGPPAPKKSGKQVPKKKDFSTPYLFAGMDIE